MIELDPTDFEQEVKYLQKKAEIAPSVCTAIGSVAGFILAVFSWYFLTDLLTGFLLYVFTLGSLVCAPIFSYTIGKQLAEASLGKIQFMLLLKDQLVGHCAFGEGSSAEMRQELQLRPSVLSQYVKNLNESPLAGVIFGYLVSWSLFVTTLSHFIESLLLLPIGGVVVALPFYYYLRVIRRRQRLKAQLISVLLEAWRGQRAFTPPQLPETQTSSPPQEAKTEEPSPSVIITPG